MAIYSWLCFWHCPSFLITTWKNMHLENRTQITIDVIHLICDFSPFALSIKKKEEEKTIEMNSLCTLHVRTYSISCSKKSLVRVTVECPHYVLETCTADERSFCGVHAYMKSCVYDVDSIFHLKAGIHAIRLSKMTTYCNVS